MSDTLSRSLGEETLPAPGPAVSATGSRPGRRLILVLAALTGLLLLLLLVRAHVLTPYRISSSSMEPTLLGEGPGRAGDTILVNRLAYLGRGPARWEVVAFWSVEAPPPGGEAPSVVKRVVGLPGEIVEVFEGEVYADGRLVPKPPGLEGIRYLRTGSFGTAPVILGPTDYFVLGDNSYPSVDSRRFGPVPRANLLGRAACIVWPPSRAGWIR